MPRTTRNSQDSLQDVSLAEPNSLPLGSSSSRAVLSPPLLAGNPSPEFIASVVDAIQAPLSAMVQSALASAGLGRPNSCAVIPSASYAGQSSSPLQTQATGLGEIGGASSWAPNAILPPLSSQSLAASHVGSSSGRPLTVPSFMSTFAGPCMSAHNSSTTSVTSIDSTQCTTDTLANTGLVSSINIQSPLALPSQQPFIVGPGYSPVPYKVVSRIVSGKFVSLDDLLSENISPHESDPQLMFDGRLVITAPAKKPNRQISDIVSWSEAFSIFSLILCTYFPHRWKDLTKYKLLILRTYRQFGGQGWLNYDKEFRQQAAAERLTDWSSMNVQVYNFNTAGAQIRPRSLFSNSESEASGNPAAKFICLSWNAGQCVAKSSSCRFRHSCTKCEGNHRASTCSHYSYSHNGPRARSLQPGDKRKLRD